MTKPSNSIHVIVPPLPENDRRPTLARPTGDRGNIFPGWGPKF